MGYAAIANRDCAPLYGLEVLDEDIQDNGNNYTRFICISKTPEIYPGADRTSIVLTVPHKPGSLSRLLAHCVDILPPIDMIGFYGHVSDDVFVPLYMRSLFADPEGINAEVIQQAAQVLEWYDGMKNVVPSWYKKA